MSDDYAEMWDNAEQVIYDNEQRIAALEAENAALKQNAARLAGIGNQMSNLCYNLAQSNISKEYGLKMAELYIAWDAALADYRKGN